MESQSLRGMKVAILVDDGFEEVELTGPRKALEDAGADALVVSPKPDVVKSWRSKQWGDDLPVDLVLEHADPNDFDALLLPGGVMNPDSLRMNEKAVKFARRFLEEGKPVAAICHGPWTVIEAGGARGRRMTSWPSLRTDLRNAGAEWVDEEAVVDGSLVTSRKPDDIPAFNGAMVSLFGRMRRELTHRH